jgi:hypothetical protein
MAQSHRLYVEGFDHFLFHKYLHVTCLNISCSWVILCLTVYHFTASHHLSFLSHISNSHQNWDRKLLSSTGQPGSCTASLNFWAFR